MSKGHKHTRSSEGVNKFKNPEGIARKFDYIDQSESNAWAEVHASLHKAKEERSKEYDLSRYEIPSPLLFKK